MNTDNHLNHIPEFGLTLLALMDSKISYEIDGWKELAKAYSKAGDMLSEEIQKNIFGYTELVFPMFFCYRHSVELTLKSLSLITSEYSGKPRPKLDHSIDLFYEYLNSFFPSDDVIEAHLDSEERKALIDFQDNRRIVSEWCKKFDEVDPGSFRFRYPEDKKGQDKHPFPELSILKIDSYVELRGAHSRFLNAASKLHSIISIMILENTNNEP